MIRRAGQPPSRGQRYRLRAGAYAILPLGGRVLLTLQTGEVPDLQLPGGGIDPGESPWQALNREVREETGWGISTPRRLGAFRRFVYMPEYDIWAEKLCHVFLARPTRRLSDPTEPGHIALILPWKEAVRSVGNAGDQYFLQRYTRARF